MLGLVALAAARAQQGGDIQSMLARVAEEAEVFAHSARAVLSEETLHQRTRKPTSRFHPRVAEVNSRACEMLREVFDAYLRDPTRLGDNATRRIEQEGLYRTVCDYVAGMTDRYLIDEFQRLCGTARSD